MAYGLRPVSHGGYQYNTGGFEEFPVDTAYGTRISNGDMVQLVADYGVQRLGTAPTPAVFAATSTVPANQALGVFVGCRYTTADGDVKFAQYYPADATVTDAFAYVVTDPNAVFKIQGTGAWTETYLGTVIDPTMTAGTGTNGNSGLVLPDYSADAAGSLRIVGVVRDGENESSSTTPDILVRWSSPTCVLYGYQTAV